jgi:hypothetical protein
MFISIDYIRDYARLFRIIRDYSTTKTQTIIRYCFITSQKTIISLISLRLFHLIFRNILLQLLRLYTIILKGLSFISNRQRRKEGTFLCVGVGGDRTHASRPGGAGYARLSPTRLGGTFFFINFIASYYTHYCIGDE